MATFLLGAAGFVGLLLGLTLVSVYCAFVISHRTDEIVAKMCEDGTFTGKTALRHT